jgi:hypothetical protein
MTVSAKDLKKKSRVELEIKDTGRVYEIRRLSKGEIASIWKGIPDVTGMGELVKMSEEEITKKVTPQQATNLVARCEAVVRVGLVSPKVGSGEDEIELYDLPENDMMLIANAIFKLSMPTKKEADTVRP